jgi:1,4-dihydroxy-2-naphthoate octaprenyltransferase
MAPLTPPPPGTPTPPRDGRLLLRMTRPAFLTVTAVACLLGLSTAAVCTGGLKVPRALATLLLALVAHAGANVLNDYFDARNGADAANDQGLFPFTGGSRLIQNGGGQCGGHRPLGSLPAAGR